MFKRREKRTVLQSLAATLYPRGGWRRALSYVIHRLRRLPDTPHKIARGVACGVLVSFTPFFGLHIVLAGALAWLIGGNLLAAILATFFGNPLTFPFIATIALELGQWVLGVQGGVPLREVFTAFSATSVELWENLAAPFTGEAAEWGGLAAFVHQIFLPYLVGGLGPGLLSGLMAYAVTIPLITAHKERRRKTLHNRLNRILAESKQMGKRKVANRQVHLNGR